MALVGAVINGSSRGLSVIVFLHSFVLGPTVLEPYLHNAYFQASLLGKLLPDMARGFGANLVSGLKGVQLLGCNCGAWSLLVAVCLCACAVYVDVRVKEKVSAFLQQFPARSSYRATTQ